MDDQKLKDLQYLVTKKGATEPAFQNKYWDNKKQGIYVDVDSGEVLFTSLDKFDSGCGWPSFTKPFTSDCLTTHLDLSHGMSRQEIKSKSSNNHLGHVFEDGPKTQGGLRYCINSASLKFIAFDELKKSGYEKYMTLFKDKKSHQSETELAYFAAGCFWGVEDIMRKIPGVINTEVGYTGGIIANPNYQNVKTGLTAHAEAIEVEYDPTITSFRELTEYFFRLHDPTTLNSQGNDLGSQYRSAIFYTNLNQKELAGQIIKELTQKKSWPNPIVTEIVAFNQFYPAEEYHQDYLVKNPQGYTCHWLREK